MTIQFLRNEYRSRINRVEDYIAENLSSEMRLDELAGIAAFSKYHFGRVFAMMTGETLFQYIQRMRVEKAASLLLTNPGISITDAAFACGFCSSQAFSRSFRQRFDVSPSRWRELGGRTPEVQKRIQTRRRENSTGTPDRERILPKDLRIINSPDIEVSYLRYTGPFQGDTELFSDLFGRLYRWADAKSLMGPETRSFCLVHDNPAITDDRKIRLSCCISVPGKTEPDREFGRMIIHGGKYACAEFLINGHQYAQAWSYLYAQWLPSSGCQPSDQPAFEEYPAPAENNSSAADEKHRVLIWLPVRPL